MSRDQKTQTALRSGVPIGDEEEAAKWVRRAVREGCTYTEACRKVIGRSQGDVILLRRGRGVWHIPRKAPERVGYPLDCRNRRGNWYPEWLPQEAAVALFQNPRLLHLSSRLSSRRVMPRFRGSRVCIECNLSVWRRFHHHPDRDRDTEPGLLLRIIHDYTSYLAATRGPELRFASCALGDHSPIIGERTCGSCNKD